MTNLCFDSWIYTVKTDLEFDHVNKIIILIKITLTLSTGFPLSRSIIRLRVTFECLQKVTGYATFHRRVRSSCDYAAYHRSCTITFETTLANHMTIERTASTPHHEANPSLTLDMDALELWIPEGLQRLRKITERNPH